MPEFQSVAPRDLLARAFLDMLTREQGASTRRLLRIGNVVDPVERLLGDLAEETDPETALRPDLAAAAVLTARAIETVPDLVRTLRCGAPVVVIATHTPDLVDLVQDVVKTCALPSDAEVHPGRTNTNFAGSDAVVLARDGTAVDHRPDRGNDVIASALHRRIPTVGIAPDPRRHLPRDLIRAAEHRLSIGALDASAVALVVEAVTGAAPSAPVDEDLVRAVDISDLPLALRRGMKADDAVALLADMIRKKRVFADSGPRLEDLAGYGDARQWGLDLAADITAYRRGELDWACVEPGLLLAGPPGVGKTQYARALARTAGVPIVATSVAEWNAANYLSGTLQAMRQAFEQARRLAPSILFIDEMDGVSDRSTLRGEHVEYWSQIVNLLLELLAGVEERPGVVVVAATNHPDKIDAAIRRAGRLDRTIVIRRPGIEDLRQIFRSHLGEALPDIDLMPAAFAARGGTGADVEAWVRRASSAARRAGRDLVLDDLLAAIRAGCPSMPPALRRLTEPTRS